MRWDKESSPWGRGESESVEAGMGPVVEEKESDPSLDIERQEWGREREMVGRERWERERGSEPTEGSEQRQSLRKIWKK